MYSLHQLTNNEKQTPLHLACQEGHTRIVEKLLKKCPEEERNDLLKVDDIEKKTALHLAVESLRISHSSDISETKVAPILLYFRVIRCILLISAYSLIITYCFVGLNTRC